MPTSSELIGKLKDAIVSSVEDKAKDFLEKHAPAKAFLEDRAKRLAKLLIEYQQASGKDRKAVMDSIEIVRQTIQNQAAEIAVDVSQEAKGWFGRIVSLAVDVLVKSLPALVGAL